MEVRMARSLVDFRVGVKEVQGHQVQFLFFSLTRGSVRPSVILLEQKLGAWATILLCTFYLVVKGRNLCDSPLGMNLLEFLHLQYHHLLGAA